MSPPRGGGRGTNSETKRARSAEDLLETSPEWRDPRESSQTLMKKAKSLEDYLDTCNGDGDDDNDDDDDDVTGSASTSARDVIKKRNFVDKCINKMKAFMMAGGKKPTAADHPVEPTVEATLSDRQ